MDLERYDMLSKEILDKAHQIEQDKRPDYTIGSPDVLANFKRVAERLGITPAQALGVYMLKHMDAITAALRDPSIPQAEALEGRFADAINYLKLAWSMVNELQTDKNKSVESKYESSQLIYNQIDYTFFNSSTNEVDSVRWENLNDIKQNGLKRSEFSTTVKMTAEQAMVRAEWMATRA